MCTIFKFPAMEDLPIWLTQSMLNHHHHHLYLYLKMNLLIRNYLYLKIKLIMRFSKSKIILETMIIMQMV